MMSYDVNWYRIHMVAYSLMWYHTIPSLLRFCGLKSYNVMSLRMISHDIIFKMPTLSMLANLFSTCPKHCTCERDTTFWFIREHKMSGNRIWKQVLIDQDGVWSEGRRRPTLTTLTTKLTWDYLENRKAGRRRCDQLVFRGCSLRCQ